MPNEKLDLVVKYGRSGLAEIRDQWLSLAHDKGKHFTHFPFWYEARVENFADDSESSIFACVYHGPRLIGVLPLEKKKIGLGFCYLQIFYPNEMGVCDITIGEGSNIEWSSLIKKLKKHVSGLLFIRLQHFWDDGHTELSGLMALAGFKKLSHQPSYLSFPNSYGDAMSVYSSKFRRNLRRLTGKAEDQGELKLSCVTQPEELKQAFSVFMTLEASGWKGEGGTSVGQQSAVKAYYTEFIEKYGEIGLCQINLLFCGETAIAGHFCLKSHKTLYLLKIAYNNSFSNLSPGQLLIDQLVQYGTKNNEFNKLHFVTDYSWMARWKPRHQNAFLAYISTSLLGFCTIKSLVLRNKVKGFLKK